MNNRRLASVIVALGVAVIFAASLPLTQVKANHCHPEHTQTPNVDTNKSVRPRASSSVRRSSNTRASNLERQRAARGKTSRPKNKPVSNDTLSLNMLHSTDIPIVMLSIDKATEAIESGDKKTVKVELNKALNALITIYKALGTHVKPQFVNNRCPIMGSPINTNIVTKILTRYYKGQKVAFCCAGCPSNWDKLTDVQKQAQLSKMEH